MFSHQFSREARFPAGLFAWWRPTVTRVLDLLYPPRCAGCRRLDSRWCAECAQVVNAIPIYGFAPTIHGSAGSASTGFHSGRLQQAVQSLKYENAQWAAEILGERLIRCLERTAWTFDMVVPVPLFSIRQRERGYNQSQLLGEIVAKRSQLPIVPQALTRQRQTASQVGLDREQRRANVSDAFSAETTLVSAKTILLIDDVYTTGATLEACVSALVFAGAKAVYTLTVTIAHH